MMPVSTAVRTTPPRRRAGFTLVELMIAVAIIGILAGVGISNFYEMQLRAKRAEPYVNLRGIADAQIGYEAANGEYKDCDSNPGAPIGKEQKDWLTGEPGWTDIGFEPDGAVRCTYMTEDYSTGTWFRVDAYCDIDDDNLSAIIRYYSSNLGAGAYFRDLYPDRF